MNEQIKIERYQIRHLLGQGGMAAVYLANDLQLEREVCLKVILPQWATRPVLVRRFMREARAMARLRHRNVVQIYDVGHAADGRPYYAMEYVPGGSLQDLLDRYRQDRIPFPLPLALDHMRQVSAGLAAIHQAGMVHRDLKPANILLHPDGTVLVSDLGIVAVDNASERLTNTGKVPGTPAYMSPEQAGGGEINAQTDIYACGIILFQLLTGRLPFEGDPLTILHQHLYKPPPDIHIYRPDTPSTIVEIVTRCLQKSVSSRLPDAATMLQAIDNAILGSNRNSAAAPGGQIASAKTAGSATKTMPWPVIGGGLGFFVLVIGLVMIAFNGLTNEAGGIPPTATEAVVSVNTNPTAQIENSVIIITPTPQPPRAPNLTSSPVPTVATPKETAPTPSRTALPTSTPISTAALTTTDSERVVNQGTAGLACQVSVGESWGDSLYEKYRTQLGCPLAPAGSPDAAYQIYHKGLMLWRADLNLVTILYYLDGSFEHYDVHNIPATYPGKSDMLKGAFGYLWNTYDHISEKIQHPTFPEANPHEFIIQDFSGGMIFYFKENNANTYVLFNADQSWFTPFE